MSVEEKLYGCQSMTGVLRRVLVRAPRAEDLHGWQRCGWRSEPDAAGIAREHEAFCSLLADAGAEVVLAESATPGNPDAIYTYDPALVADEGALLLHPGKKCRRAEVNAMAEDFERAGVPVAGRLSEAAWAEGGDCCWLDARTLLVGCGYRTNAAGIARLRELLPEVEVVAFDLPHWHGRDEVMHLMSLISPLAPDLAVVYEPLLPARLAQLLEGPRCRARAGPGRGIRLDGFQRPRPGPARSTGGRGQPGHARANGARRRRGADLPRRGALEGRRRPDVPHAPAAARLGRRTSSPPQFGHVCSSASRHSPQNVHSCEQMYASPSVASAAPQRSHDSRISRLTQR